MNQEKRTNVMNYLSSGYASLEPLVFSGYESDKEGFDIAKYPMEQIVLRTLELVDKYPSYNDETDNYECSSGRMRSSLDIWRHIKYYYPDVSIFDVMHGLYNLNHEGAIYGHFCTDICRRVFRIGGTTFNDSFQIDMRNYSGRNLDEYALVWVDWKDI